MREDRSGEGEDQYSRELFEESIYSTCVKTLERLNRLVARDYADIEGGDEMYCFDIQEDDEPGSPRRHSELYFAAAFHDIHSDIMNGDTPSTYFQDIIMQLLAHGFEVQNSANGNDGVQLLPSSQLLVAHIGELWQQNFGREDATSELPVYTFRHQRNPLSVVFREQENGMWGIGYQTSVNYINLQYR